MQGLLTSEERAKPVPLWLACIGDHLPAELPLHDLLDGSLYYPASGFDGDPIALLSGAVFSFIYVDYACTKQALEAALQEGGFRGYHELARRDVAESELRSTNSVTVHPTAAELETLSRADFQRVNEAFCSWHVFERSAGFGPEHGPERFSMLFVLADGAAAYQALYSSRGITPAILAIIQPGHAFGGNYSNFFEPGALLHRSVCQMGQPWPKRILAGWYKGAASTELEPVWPEYNQCVAATRTQRHELFLWEISRPNEGVRKGVQG
ncbi:hypothetical protein [Sphingomonas sp. LHG3406-1]|uniref:hypothetical protein n=1 Tax=Sphingomonas sp. LHG3406-1 TaxID=2804617 RepID=UPI00262F20B1|nr:hypothetical protein [Sphingomonas sp. LHG3406-1]